MWFVRIRFISLCLALVMLDARAAWSASLEKYVLAPLDRLRVVVVEWQADQGVSRDWSSINGEFAIGSDGTISLPYIGVIDAAGKTTGDLAVLVERELRGRLGLRGLPQASIEIAEYRPVFITGEVSSPGMYPYFPNMNVIKLLAVAGGIVRPKEGVKDTSAQLITNSGTRNELNDERVALLAQKARLVSEIEPTDEIDFPEEIRQHESFDAIASGEKIIKHSRQSSLDGEIAGLEDLKRLLKAELDSLDTKKKSLEEQQQLAISEMEGISALADRGLAVNAQIRSTRQFLSQTQTNLLSAETDIVRVKQALNKADRDKVTLHNNRRAELAAELQDVSSRLRVLDIKIALTVDLMTNAISTGTVGAAAQTSEDLEVQYSIIRSSDDDDAREIAAGETSAVEPGDVIKVSIIAKDAAQVGQ